MRNSLLKLLCCPNCRGDLDCVTSEIADDDIVTAELHCTGCKQSYPVHDGIPRFVESDNYASSFGYQWNRFRKEQIDAYNGTTLSADRLWSETAWAKEELKDKWVLDAGCGAGRFLDAAGESGGQIVGMDISSAIDVAKDNLKGRENIHFVQASIYELPFHEGSFDHCYCIGVIQHTPDTQRSLRALARMLKAGGKIAVTIYPRKLWTKLFPKYWVRPITKRLRKETLLTLIERIMPVAFRVTDVLFRTPFLGKAFMFVIPVANYVQEKQLNRNQRYAWAILDTFDMLSPFYDQPMTEREASAALSAEGVVANRSPQSGLNLTGVRRGTSA